MSELRLNTVTDKDTDKSVNVDALHYQNTRLIRNLGAWQPGLVFENKTDYATYNNQAIVPKEATELPYTTQEADPTEERLVTTFPEKTGTSDNTGIQGDWVSGTSYAYKDSEWWLDGVLYKALKNTTSDPVNDGVNWREVVGIDSFPKYTDIIYKASGGNSAVENMVAGFPVEAPKGVVVKCENGSSFVRRSSSPGDITSFDLISQTSVLDWGAKADDGITNNTPIFRDIRDYIVSRGGNTVVDFPKQDGAYVYEQHGGSTDPDTSYAGMNDIFDFEGLENIVFKMNHAKVKLADGTLFGSFDPVTGSKERYSKEEVKYANSGGGFLKFTDCKKYSVLNANWDGNSDNHVWGGNFGGMSSYEVGEFGIQLIGTAEDVTIDGGSFSNSGQSGIYVAVHNPDVSGSPNINITNIKCEYNVFQALELTSGSNIHFFNCSFGKSGRGEHTLMHTGGIAIEPELGRVVAGNKFVSCHIYDCKRNGLVISDSSKNPSGAYDNDFIGCSFIRDSSPLDINGVEGVVPARFTRCYFKGSSSGGMYNAQFFNCDFDDEQTEEYPDIRAGSLGGGREGDLHIQDGCTYKITQPGYPLFGYTKGIRNAKVYPSWDTDKKTTSSILGKIGDDYTWGSVEIYSRLTGYTEIPVYDRDDISSSALGEGSITVVENNGLIKEAEYNVERDDCPDYRFAAVKPLVTGMLITVNEAASPEEYSGPRQITFGTGEPSNGKYQEGDIVFNSEMSPGGAVGFVCTTGGDARYTAVFKPFGTVGD